MNDNIKIDSNNDEIVYEVKYKLGIKDTIQYIVMLFFGIGAIYIGIENILLGELTEQVNGVITLLVFGIPLASMSCYYLFYTRKNRFYITTQGIGFERRHWFRMQKGLFKFGKIGITINSLSPPLYCDAGTNIFIFYPISITYKPMAFARLRDKNYKHYIFCKVLTIDYYTDKMPTITFIRKKTKEILKSKNIAIADTELKDKIKSLNNKEI
ncbi:TPA: hypothetical protein SHD04_001847 [Campylobacter coli]|nr:hypothetical protein [Campylobacter coli]HEH5040839.1 hypothetical protein [Campylobacter coli]HEH5151888.1 hypothetical protein [Campylobacter coli]HEH5389639.1 hypothetical protein [Campylobacter coli]HEH5419180.1 hypothetical protein [Campylobacter coli]